MSTDIKAYEAAWKEVEGDFKEILSEVARQVKDQIGLDPVSMNADGHIEYERVGDEEYKLFLDWQWPGDKEHLAGMDLILNDAIAGGEEKPGLAVSVHLQSMGGAILGSYVPMNYTPFLYTTDVDELRGRCNQFRRLTGEMAKLICEHLQEVRLHRNQPGQRP